MASLIVARGVEPETTSRILIQATSRTRTDFDEYDAYNDADSLAGIDFDSIDALRGSYRFDNPVPAQATTSGATQPSGSSPGLNDEEHLDRLETASSTSTQYAFDEIDMNEAFLQELDLIERNALGTNRPPEIKNSIPILLEDNKVSTGLSTQLSTPSTRKRKRSSHEERASSLSKRSRVDGKSRLDHRAVARGVLAKLEECFNCPICFDLFVDPHINVPCGHSFCGECVLAWIKKRAKRSVLCPVCQVQLDPKVLAVQNFALKSAVEQHINACAEAGDVDWQSVGEKYQDWMQREARWLILAPELAGLRLTPKEPPPGIHLAESTDSDEDSSSDEDW